MDEEYLVKAAQKGDLDAFNRLVLEYQEISYNVAYRILLDEAASEDATQNAFISAYQSIGSFRGGSFRSWVLRIVTNACYDELRRRKRRPTTPLEPYIEESDEEIESPYWIVDQDAPDPVEMLEREEIDQAVRRCMEALPDEFRTVVVMVDVQGFDYQETSEVIGSPLGTVKSRLARARLRLRECLQKVWELLPVEFRLDIEESL